MFEAIRHSATVDLKNIFVDDDFVRIGSWYNRVTGFVSRAMDLLKHMMAVDPNN